MATDELGPELGERPLVQTPLWGRAYYWPRILAIEKSTKTFTKTLLKIEDTYGREGCIGI
jgi:hypothetical protein